ncbi:MAG: M3 family oligoendopeptidase [Oscillospiraceae bacterium]|nr:M3 family oligoendopeptidase [Oscillospiraceae bacterium]
MKFSEMKYTRPDMETLKAAADKAADSIKNAKSPEEAAEAYLQWDKAGGSYNTMYSLCYIRHTINTEDKFYSNENEFFDNSNPTFTEYGQAVAKALAESRFRRELEKKFGRVMFINTDIFLKSFSPEIIPEMQEDNKLTTEYEKLIASAQIDFDGKKLTLSQLTPYKQSPDNDIRHKAWAAESGFYKEHEAELDRIYDELVRVRNAEAVKMGFENYVPLGYLNMCRNSYTAEDVARFREAVVKYLVPAADRIYREQAERIGVSYPLKYPDTSVFYRDGNALPKGTPEDILEAGKRFYNSLSPLTAEFFEFMTENELMDVLSRKGKAAGGYCTELTDYEAPFIFANFNGTQGDVEVITHEAGHAFAAYVNRHKRPTDNQLPTLESCEIHSMTMEFFGWASASDFFGEDGEKFCRKHLADAIKFIPYGTMVDHFQHIVYEKPQMTPEERIEEWKKLTAVYMPWIDLDGSPFYGEGRAWQRQTHIYERPFYYIDYCLAQTVALEFWAIMQRDRNEAFERYMKLVSLGGTETFDGLVAAAGLDTPFGDMALKTVAEAAVKWLDENPIK